MTEENKRDNISLEVAKGESELEMAEILLASSKFDGVVSHSYYAAFHHGKALLLMEGLESRTHGGVTHLLNIGFVRTGRLPLEAVHTLGQLHAARQSADYDAAALFNQVVAERALQEAREFARLACRLLKEARYLD